LILPVAIATVDDRLLEVAPMIPGLGVLARLL
jgi:hypothetical protein